MVGVHLRCGVGRFLICASSNDNALWIWEGGTMLQAQLRAAYRNSRCLIGEGGVV